MKRGESGKVGLSDAKVRTRISFWGNDMVTFLSISSRPYVSHKVKQLEVEVAT